MACHSAPAGVEHSQRRADPPREPATAHRARRRLWPAAGRWLLATALLCGVSSSRQCSESWTAVSRSSGPASGGFALSIAGTCLRNGTDVHSVVFSCPGTGESVAVSETTTSEHDSNTNASTVALVAPSWGFAACDTVITLQNSSGAVVPHLGGANISEFKFLAGWVSTDQPVGLLAGGTILSVIAFGLDVAAAHQCVFTGTSSLLRRNVTAAATSVSSTKLVCVAPDWPAWPTPAEASVTVYAAGRILPLEAVGDVRIRFTAEGWTSASPAKVFASGGTTLTVLGMGFSTTATDYTARFSAGHDVETTPCTPSSSRAMACPIPRWPHGENNLRVEVQRGGVTIGKGGGIFSLQVVSYWNTYAGARLGKVTGGSVVTITGYGFRTAGQGLDYVGYGLNLAGIVASSSPRHAEISSMARVVDTSTVVFTTPEWDVEQTVAISLLRSIDGDIFREVLFSGSAGGDRFDYIAQVERVDMLFREGIPHPRASVGSEGGTAITLTGTGFSNADGAGHLCRFTCLSSFCVGETVDSPVDTVNSTYMTCASPPWTRFTPSSALTITRFSVVRSDDPSLTLFTRGPPLEIDVTKANWRARPDRYQSYTAGGGTVDVTGSNFCYNENSAVPCDNYYLCEFSSVVDPIKAATARYCAEGGAACKGDAECEGGGMCSEYVVANSNPARIVNSTAIVCRIPEWPFPATVVRLTLIDVSYGSVRPTPVGTTGAIPLVEYTPAVYSLAAEPPPATGGALVTIQGSFFPSSLPGGNSSLDYSCSFSMAGVTLESPEAPRAVGLRELVCVVPRWPRHVTAGFTNVTVLRGGGAMPTLTGAPFSIGVFGEWTGMSGCNLSAILRGGDNASMPGSNSSLSGNADEDAGFRARNATCNVTGFATGGFPLEVYGWGLDPAFHHELHFTDIRGNVLRVPLTLESSSPMAVDRAVVGALPPWPFPAGRTRVSLHRFPNPPQSQPATQGSMVVPDQGGAVFFEFEEMADAVTLSWHRLGCGDRCWPSSVEVRGFGFQNMSATARFNRGDIDSINHVEYSCILTGMVNVSSLASSFVTIESPGVLRCFFGRDGDAFPTYVSQDFALTLSHNGVPLPWTSPEPRVVFLSEAWTGLTCRGSRWCTARASGGELLLVTGYGFNHAVQYWCRWSRGGGEEMSSMAEMDSSEALSCEIPAWSWEEGAVDFTVLKGGALNAATPVLRDESAPVLPDMQLEATWWFADLQEGYVTGDGLASLVRAAGNDERLNLTITARGLVSTSTYRARFSGHTSDGAPAQTISGARPPENASHLVLPVPAFSGAEGLASVEMLKCDAMGNRCAGLLPDAAPSLAKPGGLIDAFRLLAVWTRAAMPTLMEAPHGRYCYPDAAIPCWAPSTGNALIQVVGVGFSESLGRSGAEKYQCLLRDASPGGVTVYSDAEVASGNLLRCKTAPFPNGSLLVAIGVVSPFSSELSLLSTHPSFPVFLEATVDTILPTRGPASGSLLTISGFGFSTTPGAYACRFYRSTPTGHEWIPDQSSEVVADPRSPREMVCNTSGAWSAAGFSAGGVKVEVEHLPSDAVLLDGVDAWGVVMNVSASLDVLGRMRVGVYVRVGKEVLLVTAVTTVVTLVPPTVVTLVPPADSNWAQFEDAISTAGEGNIADAYSNRTVVTVVRARQGTQRAFHAARDPLEILVPLSWRRLPHELDFLQAITTISQPSILADGGELLHVSGGGFSATLLPAMHTLPTQPAGCDAPGEITPPPGITPGVTAGYWGVAFDLYASRALSVTSIHVEAISNGPISVWVLARKRSTCGGVGEVCSHWDFETNLAFWELAAPTPTQVMINGTRLLEVKIPDWDMAAGETRGFLVVADAGLRISVMGDGNASEACGSSGDSLLTVRAGRSVFGRSSPPGNRNDALLATEGGREERRALFGRVSYRNHEIVGDTYRCRFHAATGLVKTSEPTRAFSLTDGAFDGASSLACLTPPWPWAETSVGFTVVGDATGEALFYPPDAAVGAPFAMPVRASWREMLAPLQGLADGGAPITLRGAGFNTSFTGYQCRFSMEGGDVFATGARAVSWSEAVCMTPLLVNSSAGVARVDLVGGVDPAVAWQTETHLNTFSAGNPAGHSCLGDECASGNSGGPACLTYPCRHTHYALAPSGYANREIRMLESLGTIAPSEGPASGGSRITFSGEGFRPPSSTASYICAFSTPAGPAGGAGGGGWSVSFDAVPLPGHESSRLICETPSQSPAWGSRFPGVVSVLAGDALARAELLRRDWPTSLLAPVAPGDASPARATVTGAPPVGYRVFAVQVGSEILEVGAPTVNGSHATSYPILSRGAFGTAVGNHTLGASASLLAKVNVSAALPPRMAFVTSWSINSTTPPRDTYAGLTVTLVGSGFDVAQRYRFRLKVASGQTVLESSFASPSSPTALVLSAGAWTSTEPAASLLLVNEAGKPVCALGAIGSCDGAGGIAGFVTSWRTLTPSSILARSGQRILLSGLGFRPSGTGYTCVLLHPPGNTSVPATALSATAMECIFPLWDRSAASAPLLLLDGAASVIFAGGGSPAVEVVAGWDMVMTTGDSAAGVMDEEVQRVRASGGAVIAVVGYGFDSRATDYSCAFTSISSPTHTLASPATALNSTRLACTLPAFGASFPASRVEVSISRGTQRLPLTKGGGVGAVGCDGAGACTLEVLAVWTHAASTSPTQGSAAGGDRVTVVGSGFDARHNYTCLFTRFGATARSDPAAPASTTTLVCTTPAWRAGGGAAALTINGPSSLAAVESAGGGFSFEFLPSWTGVDVTRAPALGGVVVTMSGFGFYLAPIRYECVFSRGNTSLGEPIQEVRWLADHVDSETLACVIRPWLFREGLVRLSLSQRAFPRDVDATHPGTAPPSVTTVLYNPPLPPNASGNATRPTFDHSPFTFYDGWNGFRLANALSHAPPPLGWQVPAAGNTTLLIDSFGLDTDSARASYSCVFTRNSDGVSLESPGTPISSVLLSCRTPAWGTHFAGAAGAISPSTRDLGLVSVVVVRTGPQDPPREVPLMRSDLSIITTTPCGEGDCQLLFLVEWKWAGDASSGSSRISSVGGANLIVTGAGFDVLETYLCRFSRGALSADSDLTSWAHPMNATHLPCVAPAWVSDAGGVSLQVILTSSSELVAFAGAGGYNASGFAMTYVAEWSAVNASTAPAKGGKPMFVTGFGFDTLSTAYACRFFWNASSAWVDTPATILSRTLLRCPSPTLDSARGVSLAVVDKDGPLLTRDGQLPPQHLIHVFQGWDRRVDTSLYFTADRDIRLDIVGYGFSGSGYLCTFTGISSHLSETVSASRLSPTVLRCTIPAWGKTKPFDQLLLTLTQNVTNSVDAVAFTDGGLDPRPVFPSNCAATKCLISILPTTDTLSVTQGSNEGGTVITVHGHGFAPDSTFHRCLFWTGNASSVGDSVGVAGPGWESGGVSVGVVFQNGSQHVLSEVAKTKVIDSRTLECISPPWPYAAPATVSMQVTNTVNTLQYTFADNQYWVSKIPATARAKGGETVVVVGKGFILDAGDYQCRFVSLDGNWSANASATVLSSSLLSCILPPFTLPAQTLSMDVIWGGSPLERTGDPGEALLQLLQGWDSIEGVGDAPLNLSSVDAPSLMLVAYGLSEVKGYVCAFSRGFSEEMDTPGEVLNATRIRCPSPQWGTAYPSGPHAGGVSLTLVESAGVMAAVPFTADAFEVQDTLACADAPNSLEDRARCSVVFQARWDPSSLFDEVDLAGAGGDALSISGAGFDPLQPYVCELRWTSPDTHTSNIVQSVSAKALSISSLQCVTGPWNFKHVANARVVVREGRAGALLEPSSTLVVAVAVWQGYTSLSPANASAAGGAPLAIHGFGFDASAQYWCQLIAANHTSLRNPATVASPSLLTCPVPVWLAPAQLAGLKLWYQAAGGGGVVAVSPATSPGGAAMVRTATLPLLALSTEWAAVLPGFSDRLGVARAPLAPAITVVGHGFDAGASYRCVLDEELEASEDVATPPVRLANVNAEGCGRLEFFFEEVWGTVCDDLFSDREATVVCRHLNFAYAGTARAGAFRGEGNGPVWLDSFSCLGTELRECTHEGVGVTNCGHDEDVSVCCVEGKDSLRLADVDQAGCGRVEVRHGGVWGTVCDNFFDDDDATVVCNHLGRSRTAVARRGAFNGQGSAGMPIWLDDLVCLGSEKFLEDCQFPGWGVHDCSHSEDASACCTDADSLRLINTDADGCGRLEMFHAGSWGTVCDAGFDELDARVACRQLGLSDTGRVGYTVVGAGPGAPVVWTLAARSVPGAAAGQGVGQIWMSGVACEGTERFLEECVPASYTWGVSAGCSHTDDVSVCCPPPRLSRTAASAIATVRSSEEIVCPAPEWDAVHPWSEYVDRSVRMRVQHSSSSAWVAPANGTNAPGMGSLSLVHVNLQPEFTEDNLDLTLYEAPVAHEYHLANWSNPVVAGRAVGGFDQLTAELTELPQQVTFSVALLTPAQAGLFATLPTVTPKGALSFKVKENRYGLAHMRVTLRDDGGVGYGGVDAVVSTFTVKVVPLSATTFSDAGEISVAEGSGLHVIADFIYTLLDRRWDKMLHTTSFETSANNPAYFDELPSIDPLGSLRFRTGAKRFGRTNISVSLVDLDILSGITTRTARTVPLNILPVNSKPSFSAPAQVFVYEDAYLTGNHFSAPFASSIIPGPDTLPGPQEELWDESGQTVSFVVELVGGGGSIFAAQPTISADGILNFTLAEHQSGNGSFSLRLVDSGGRALGGSDTSDAWLLTIVVQPLNDAPIFTVSCDAPVAEGILTCTDECAAGAVLGCGIQVTIDENCVNCAEHPMPGGCVGGFIAEGFIPPGSIAPSMYGAELEATQRLSFVIELGDGADFLFHTPPRIDVVSGDLTFCLAQDANGNATFSINLVDDGGTDAGGVDHLGPAFLTVKVYPVNQQPFFHFCDASEGGGDATHPGGVGDFCSLELPIWKSARLQKMPGFLTDFRKGGGGGKAPAGFGDEEAEQDSTFSVGAVDGGGLLAGDMRIDVNGTMVLRAGMQGVQAVTVTMADDGALWDAAAGTQQHNLDSGISYSGVDTLAQDFVLHVVDSYLRLTLAFAPNTTSDIHRNSSACGTGNASCAPPPMQPRLNTTHLLALSRLAAHALSLTPSLVRPFVDSSGGVGLDVLGASFNETLSFQGRSMAVADSLQAWDTPWRVSLSGVEARVRGWDHEPAFNVTNRSVVITGRSDAPRHLYDGSYPPPLSVVNFLEGITSPEHSRLGADGNEEVLFSVTAVRHTTLRPPTFHGLDIALASLMFSGPNVTSTCRVDCVNASGTLRLQQNPRVYGVVEYAVQMLGSDLVHNITIESRMLLNLVAPIVLVVQEDQGAMVFPDAVFVEGVPGPVALQGCSFSLTTMLGSALFATPPHLTTRENGTAGKNAVEYTLAPNMFGNASILVSAECDDPDAHGWLRQVVNVTLVVLPVNDAPFFLYNCSAPYHIAPATVHTTCLPRCSATAPGSALACGILLPVEENCAGCALGPSPGPSPMEGCLFPLVVPGLVYATAPSDSDAVIPEAQTLTFHITPLSPSAASRLLDARFPTPTIDVASGTLSACLAPNQHGEALFNVTLSDSGGRARSGEDSSWELLTLRIIRINIRPSFSLMLPYTLSAFDEAAAPDFTYSCSGGYGCVGPPPLPEEDDAY